MKGFKLQTTMGRIDSIDVILVVITTMTGILASGHPARFFPKDTSFTSGSSAKFALFDPPKMSKHGKFMVI